MTTPDPVDAFDFSTVSPESVRAAADAAIAEADRHIDAVAADPERTFASTLARYDASTVAISGAGSAAFMAYVHPDQAVRDAGHEAHERLEHWLVDRAFRTDLAEAVTGFAATDEARHLDGEQARLLEFVQRALRQAGHGLPADARAEVQGAKARLVELGVKFEQNIAECDDSLILPDDDLEGLPASYRDGLATGTEPGTYKLTMAYPDVYPFLENAVRRERREQVSRMFNNRAVAENRPILEEVVALRDRVAELFGVLSWAHHRMDHRMADTPEAVDAFYAELVDPLTAKARDEVAAMSALLKADTGDDVLQTWDWRYYDTQLRKSDFGVDPFEVAAYFPLDRVLDGLLDITGEVFGLTYEPVDLPVWHRDVRSLTIVDRASGERIATAHMDLHPRDGKFGHAAAWDLVPGHRGPDGAYVAPVSAIVANFTKPTPERPSLLTHDEVVTLFHEFGHVLHQTLTRAELVEFAGTSVERDFVEAPSQIMEHWCWQPEVLTRFARHHETGKPIPAELVEQLTAARDLNVALLQLRQMQLGVLDMGFHGPRRPGESRPDGSRDLDAITERAGRLSGLPLQEGTFMAASFGHLLSGYDAGYYGYMWSEVFGDDMFSRFAADGLTSAAVGGEYRAAILERGGTADAIELIRRFLRREPNNKAFLDKLGIAA